MTSKEEFLKKERLLGESLNAILKSIDNDVAAIKNVSKSTSTFFESLHKLDQIKKKEFLQYRIDFRKFFLGEIEKADNHREELIFVYGQLSDLQLKIEDAKANNQPWYQECYQNALDNIVLPFKNQLTELVRLENEVGTLKKVVLETPQALDGPVTVTLEAAPIQSELKEQPEVGRLSKKSEEIFISINIVDKSLETQTGKPLNNAKHIAGGRKFTWSDERIPYLISVFLLEHSRIFDYQLSIVQDFFKTARCNYKIVFDGNANILTTILYDLLENDYLKVSTEFLAERIELVFVRKDDTTRPLITKSSIKATIKPTNAGRRLKKGASDYPDIISWLQKKLLSPA